MPPNGHKLERIDQVSSARYIPQGKDDHSIYNDLETGVKKCLVYKDKATHNIEHNRLLQP